jgi:hypothetical protein
MTAVLSDAIAGLDATAPPRAADRSRHTPAAHAAPFRLSSLGHRLRPRTARGRHVLAAGHARTEAPAEDQDHRPTSGPSSG